MGPVAPSSAASSVEFTLLSARRALAASGIPAVLTLNFTPTQVVALLSRGTILSTSRSASVVFGATVSVVLSSTEMSDGRSPKMTERRSA
eukprot:scaffold61250_cov65-Phaeocystis_antarctica.AAC.5